MQQAQEPGWYDDENGVRRYWDGDARTEQPGPEDPSPHEGEVPGARPSKWKYSPYYRLAQEEKQRGSGGYFSFFEEMRRGFISPGERERKRSSVNSGVVWLIFFAAVLVPPLGVAGGILALWYVKGDDSGDSQYLIAIIGLGCLLTLIRLLS